MTDTLLIRRCVGIVLAVLLVIGLGFFCCDSLLEADEYVPVNEVVTEPADTADSTSVRTVELLLSREEGTVEIADEDVPRAAYIHEGPNKYLMLASVFVPMLLTAGVWGIIELKKKKERFYSFTSL